MGNLSGLHESLKAIVARPAAMTNYDFIPEPEDTAILDAVNALISAVNGIKLQEHTTDFGPLVKALKSIQFPKSKTADLLPLVEAIKGLELVITIPESPKPLEPCPYTFTIVRDSSGVLSGVIATPGIVAAEPAPDRASYE